MSSFAHCTVIADVAPKGLAVLLMTGDLIHKDIEAQLLAVIDTEKLIVIRPASGILKVFFGSFD